MNLISRQGHHSYTTIQNHRVNKSIKALDAYGQFVGYYQEYKLLKYISKLGPEFPQNVKGDILTVSYDYIPGISVEDYVENNNPLTISQEKNIIMQILKIYRKLFMIGVSHNDAGLSNFIIDPNHIIHIIDFGFGVVHNRKIIGEYNEDTDITEPLDEYEDLDYILPESEFGKILQSFFHYIEDTDLNENKNLWNDLMQNLDNYDRLITILS